jgi:hypothetical protein
MDRRNIIALFGGTICGWPVSVRGQEPGRTYRIGALNTVPRDTLGPTALYDALSRLGFVEDQNRQIDRLRPDQVAQHAAELVAAKADVIFCDGFRGGAAAIRAAQQATATISILGGTEDMVGEVLVGSLTNPGGNTTLVSLLATELDGKRHDLGHARGASRLGGNVEDTYPHGGCCRSHWDRHRSELGAARRQHRRANLECRRDRRQSAGISQGYRPDALPRGRLLESGQSSGQTSCKPNKTGSGFLGLAVTVDPDPGGWAI